MQDPRDPDRGKNVTNTRVDNIHCTLDDRRSQGDSGQSDSGQSAGQSAGQRKTTRLNKGRKHFSKHVLKLSSTALGVSLRSATVRRTRKCPGIGECVAKLTLANNLSLPLY